MSALIVAIPLFGEAMTVKAYKLCDHAPNIALDTKDDFRGRSQIYYLPGLEIVQKIGIEPFSSDMPLFVDTNRFHILTGMFSNKNIPAEKLILTVSASLDIDSSVLMGLEGLRGCGYSIAVDGYPKDGLENHLIGFADHIILDFEDKQFSKRFEEIKRVLPGKQVVVFNLPDSKEYEKLSRGNTVLCTGNFYKNPVTQGDTEISPLKVNALRLLKQINEEDFDLKNIAQTIERDPALSISLLSFINSPAVGLRSKVGSINNAVAILGQRAVQRWATIAISMGISEDKPGEVTKLSLVRAKFAENLAPLFELGVFQNSLFMTGLFSLLDIILKKPMDEAIKEVAVDNMVQEALLHRTGRLYSVMDLVYAYEKADWNKLSIMMIQNNIPGDLVGEAFVEALVWYYQLLTAIEGEDDSGGNLGNGSA